MAKLSETISRLQELLEKHGDVDVRVVNYHSDYNDDEIKDLSESISYVKAINRVNFKNTIAVYNSYVLIGGGVF